MMRVFRVQDREGRGPFRSGFSITWADADFAAGMTALPSWMEEFGFDLIDRLGKSDEHFGTAVRSLEKLNRWFSRTEQSRLAALGFSCVSLRATRILAESANQLVFARKTPLRNGAIVVPWPAWQGELVA